MLHAVTSSMHTRNKCNYTQTFTFTPSPDKTRHSQLCLLDTIHPLTTRLATNCFKEIMLVDNADITTLNTIHSIFVTP